MLSFFFMFVMLNNVPLMAIEMPASDEGIDESIIIEREYKGGKSGGDVHFYSEVTPVSRFLKYVAKFCATKKSPRDRVDAKEDLIGVIKDNPHLIESQKINGQFPLSFAFNNRDDDLVEIFARAEQAFFPDDRDSQVRRNVVLYSAVNAQEPGAVGTLLKCGASASTTPDLLTELVTNCELRKKSCWSCWVRVDRDKEQSALKIAKSLAEHGAPCLTAVATAIKFGCTGAGCSYIRQLTPTPTAPPG